MFIFPPFRPFPRVLRRDVFLFSYTEHGEKTYESENNPKHVKLSTAPSQGNPISCGIMDENGDRGVHGLTENLLLSIQLNVEN
jgi:hypothetical protein